MIRMSWCFILILSFITLYALANEEPLVNVRFNDIWFLDSNTAYGLDTFPQGYSQIVRTTDGGRTWTSQLKTRTPPYRFYFLDDKMGWVMGQETYRTENGGITWKPHNINIGDTILYLYFSDAQKGLGIGMYGLITSTEDGRQTWQELSRIPFNGNGRTNDAVFVDATTGWVVGREKLDEEKRQSFIFHTNDGGKTWQRQKVVVPEIPLYAIDFFDANVGWVIGYQSEVEPKSLILHTDDGGQTWRVQHRCEQRLRDIQALSPQEAWAVGTETVLHTVDGGMSWVSVKGDFQKRYMQKVQFLDAKEGYLTSKWGYIYYTTDGGQSWETVHTHNPLQHRKSYLFLTDAGYRWEELYLPINPYEHYIYSICFPTPQHGRILGRVLKDGEEDDVIWRTDYGGKSWQQNSIDKDQGKKISHMIFTTPNEGWISYQQRWDHHVYILHTTDGGRNWKNVFHKPNADIRAMQMFPSGDGYAWVVGVNMLYWTHDKGQRWNSMPNPGAFSFFFLDKDYGWAMSDEGLMRTTDGGKKWHVINHKMRFNGKIKVDATLIFFVDTQVGWLAIADEGGGACRHTDLYCTENGGKTWVESGSFDGPIKDLYAPNRRCAICIVHQMEKKKGRISHLYHTSDEGETWVEAATSPANLSALAFDGKETIWLIADPPFMARYSDVSLRPEGWGVSETGKQLVTWGALKRAQLLQNYPNPFNPVTWIPYTLAESNEVTIRIYDVSGHLVRHLPLGLKTSGSYHSKERAAYWDGTDAKGETVASGVYFYQIQVGDFAASRKMLLLK